MRKKALILAAFIIALCLFSGCGCEHEWQDATCLAPKTCALCQETEGELGSHSWTAATCKAPKTCTLCAETEGDALGHKWEDATCATPAVCSVCAETAGAALGHDWKDATCTQPDTCYTCGMTNGEALGHKADNWAVTVAATCTEAGAEAAVCTVCSEPVEREIALAEHSPGEWEITTEPTEDSEGTRTRSCTVCGASLETEQFTLTPEELEARYKERCQSISYKELSRSPDEYKDAYVKFSGKVVQICSEADSPLYYSTYRVATSGSYDNVVLIYVDNYGSGERILEDDRITFYGKFDGLYTYTTVMGASLTIPSIKVEYID